MACHPRDKTHRSVFVVYAQITTGYSRRILSDVIIPDHFSIRKTLIARAAPTFLSSLIVTGILLIAFCTPISAQRDRELSRRPSAEAESQAEELFRQALISSDTTDRKSTRLRLQEAMSIWTRLRESEKAAQAAVQIGDRYRQERKYQDALYYYDLALRVKPLPGSARANALNATGRIYAELYLDDLAISSFKKALDQARLVNYLPAQKMALIGLANLYYRQSSREQALKCIAQAQRLNQRSNADADPALLYLIGGSSDLRKNRRCHRSDQSLMRNFQSSALLAQTGSPRTGRASCEVGGIAKESRRKPCR
jgi:tetratricopeptide (TPR) repeat protein